MIDSYFKSNTKDFNLILGDSNIILDSFDFKFDLVYADPPYFLSNGGLTIQNGEIVSVNKAEWDKLKDKNEVNSFNYNWLNKVKNKMKFDSTIWISCSMHNIFSVGNALQELDFKIINIITWEKTNPPPNFSKKYFNFSTEFIIWAKFSSESNHFFDYNLMKEFNDNKQMKDIWKLPSIQKYEKTFGKHPTQKPLKLLSRIILSSTKSGDWVLDPFCGSSTTGIAANLFDRKFLGIEKEKEYLDLSIKRKNEILNLENKELFLNYLKL